MEVVHIGEATELIKELPTAPGYFDASSKRNYKRMGNVLISADILKAKHLPTLEIFAVEFAQFEFAVKAIITANKAKPGSGYIQKFSTGAKNISAEVTLKQQAEKQLFICLRRFGLDPKSEKELDASTDPNQTNLLEQLLGKKKAAN